MFKTAFAAGMLSYASAIKLDANTWAQIKLMEEAEDPAEYGRELEGHINSALWAVSECHQSWKTFDKAYRREVKTGLETEERVEDYCEGSDDVEACMADRLESTG